MEDPVAVIGFGLRFPGDAVDENAFWNIIVEGRSTMTEVPKSRYNIDGFFSRDKSSNNHLSCRGGHFVTGDISAFDAPFFAMGGAEAKAMDPQLRLMLETTYHALENSGLSMEAVRGSATSVYVGNLTADYSSLFGDDEEIRAAYQATGMSGAMLSNRISWFYDLRGPSMTLDTACSSSLVGLHLACQSILQGETEMGLVGGVRLQLNPTMMTLPLARQNFLSPDSLCYSFDDRANGYSRGEGIGMVVLKRLSKAITDGNTIRAVIRGTSSNQDGRTPVISQPSSQAQAALIRKAYEAAGLDFKSTQYFEAHGTGTPVGDPIEAEGIREVFSSHLTPESPMYIGSVKANIGHLESTAGVASVIKAVLALEHGVIPPNALLKRLNPRIRAEEWNLKFPTAAVPWPSTGQRRASVNSFGVGGANAHVVLDDALHYLQNRGLKGRHNTLGTIPITNGDATRPIANGVNGANGVITNGHTKSGIEQPSLFFPLSAADEDGISRVAYALEGYLGQRDNVAHSHLQDIAFTLSEKRGLLPWKAYAAGSNAEELRQSLASLPIHPMRATQAPEITFVFTGQGAQWARMGIELVDRYKIFHDAIESADTYFRSLGATWSLIDELRAAASKSKIDDPQLAQPSCTAIQIALTDLMASWNITPRTVVGHSSGEIAAAYAVGALSKTGALRVAYYRGEAAMRLAEVDTERGGMLAVALSEAELTPYIAAVTGEGKTDCLSCGCLNSPQNTTVTGIESYINALSEKLKADGIFNRKLSVPVAYHSPQMLKVADEYRAALIGNLSAGASDPNAKTQRMISSVTLKAVNHEGLADPEYWVQNLVSKVRFCEALERMSSSSATEQEDVQSDLKVLTHIIEVGPHSALERSIRETLSGKIEFIYGTALRRDVSPVVTLQRLAGDLLVHNHPLNIQEINMSRNIHRSPDMLLDLPLYPFNHSRTYWLESRLSQNRRTRASPRHDFLGIPSADWNPLKPKWRFTIRVSDLPWVVDHKVDNTVLYPGTGFLVMVLEAVRSLTANSTDIAGFRIRDVKIPSALVIPEDEDGIEAQLHLHAQSHAPGQSFQAWDFNIYSVSGDDWKLLCSGQVAAEPSEATDLVSPNSRYSSLNEDINGFDSRNPTSRDPNEFYEQLRQQGYHFGANFKTLENIRVMGSEPEAMATVRFGQYRQQMERGEISEHLVHPATLDSLCHVMMATQFKGNSLPRVVPTHLSDIFVSLGELGNHSMDMMKLHGRVDESTAFGIHGQITAISGTTGKPAVIMRGCRFSSIASTEQRDALPEPTSLFHRMHWKPDVSLLSRGQLEHHLKNSVRNTVSDGGDLEAEIVCRHFMSTALKEFIAGSGENTKPHMEKYIAWVKNFNDSQGDSTESLIREVWPEFKDVAARPALIEKWAKGAQWRAKVVLFCENLVQILRDEIDPLDILFNQGVAEAIYQSPLLTSTTSRLAAYVDLLAHKNSNINILEVGAGTGSTTNLVLNALTKQGGVPGASPRFNHYTFTDISPSFFAEAQERYAQHASRMKFKVLDLEVDPNKQGFEEQSYDIIVAAAVLHATADIDKTINHVKKLLKPGGQLVFSEPTNKLMASTAGIFGVLPGWWLAIEKYRTGGPLMSPLEWNEAVQRAGFKELRVSLPDNVEHMHMTSLLSTSLPSQSEQSSDLPIAILAQSPGQQELAQTIQTSLSSDDCKRCEIMTMESIANNTTVYSRCISLLEFEEPFMAHLGEVRFTQVQNIVQKFSQIIWVTSEGGALPTKPESVFMSGFAKSIMREDPSRSLIYLNVNSVENAATTIARVAGQISKVPANLAETDLLEEDGIVFIPRVVEAPQVNRLLDSTLHGTKPEPVEVSGDIKDAIELRFAPGRLDSFHFGTKASLSKQLLLDNEVVIHVKATGVSYRDVMVMQNQLPSSELGCEIAGVVTEAGANAGFNPGDKVCAFALSGGFHSYVRVASSQVIAMPPGISFTEASAVPLAYTTAQYALSHVARLRAGETILIHAAAGGVGQAAIQIAQNIGATVYVTVGTPEKKKLLMESYGIEASRCFSSRHVSFAQQLMQATAGRGVDVVLNSLSGLALTETWRCMAPLGRFIDIGKRDSLAVRNLPMEPFQRNVSYSSVDMTIIGKLDERLMNEIKNEVQTLFLAETHKKFATPRPIAEFGLSEVEKALRLIQTGQHMGKVVVSWERKETIQVIPKSPLDYRFDKDSTYVITGGLGGIGRSLALWMAELGARHLVLLSRSGIKSDAAKELVAKLKTDGVDVYAPVCDISNEEHVKKAATHVQATMPPIKGCIHGALVVINHFFRDFSYQEFQDTLDPKLRGTWNLHDHLPTDLDFFVMLSSIAGVNGAASQSPYAGASIFEDAFARFRHAQGQHCVSLDLGVVQEVGYVAERVDVARFLAMSMTDHKALTVDELHFMLKYACSPHTRAVSPWDTQVIGALTTPAFIRRRGVIEDHGWMRMPVFCHLYQMEQEDKAATAAAAPVQVDSVESQLAETKTLTEAAEVITRALAKRLARALAVSTKDIDISKPPFAFGVDSLVAVELIFWFSNEIRADIPVIQILGNHTIAQLGAHAAGVSGYVPASVRQGKDDAKRP